MADNTRQKQYDTDRNRGIQNAQTRYETHAENRQLRTQLLKGGVRESADEEAKRVAEMDRERGIALEYAEQEEINENNIRATRIAQEEVRKTFRDAGENLNDAEVQQLLERPPKKPSFPFIILAIAVLKDLLDIPAYVSIIGIIVVWFTTFFMSLILFLWVLGYASGRTVNRGLGRLAIGSAVEVFFGFVPAASIFVLVTYHSERKLWKIRTEAREKLQKLGVR